MNPFDLSETHNSELFLILSKITKKSPQTKIKALQQLQENLNNFDTENNLYDIIQTLSPMFKIEDYQIKTVVYEILIDLCIKHEQNNLLEPVIPYLIIYSIENTNIEKLKNFVRKLNYKKYINDLFSNINYSENKNTYFKIIIVALKLNYDNKHIQELIKNDFKNYEIVTEIELKYLKTILEYFKENDEIKNILFSVISKIDSISCLNLKWDVLIDFFDYLNSCDECEIIKDSKYLNLKIIEKIILKRKINFDLFVANSREILDVIFPLVVNKEDYIIKFININPIKNMKFNIFKYIDSIDTLNKNCEFEKINAIIKFIEENNLWDNHSKTNTLNYLSSEQLMIRADMLKLKLDVDLPLSSIKNVFPFALNVLNKEYFQKNIGEFQDNKDDIMIKFPELITLSYIKEIIYNKTRLIKILPYIKSEDILSYLENYMRTNYQIKDFLFIYDNSIIPERLYLLFYFCIYSLRNITPKIFSSTEILEKYFNLDFILHLDEKNSINWDTFFVALFSVINELKIDNSTFYSSDFYYLNSNFYDDLKEFPFDNNTYKYLSNLFDTLLKIKENFDKKSKKNNSLLFLIMLIAEIMQKNLIIFKEIEITEKVIKNICNSKFYFSLKIFFDLQNKNIIDISEIKHVCKVYDENKKFDYFDFYKLNNQILDINTSENFDNYANIYLILKSDKKLDKNALNKLIKIKNKRIQNLIGEKLLFTKYNDDILFRFGGQIDQDLPIIENKIHFVVDDTNFYSDKSLKKIFLYEFDSKNHYKTILDAIENDFIWNNLNLNYRNRRNIFHNFLEQSYKVIANDISNYYNLSRFEENAIEEEIFELITNHFGFNKKVKSSKNNFIWLVLIRSVFYIRNVNILFFMEKMLRNYDYNQFLKNNIDDLKVKEIFAFNFPGLYDNDVDLSFYLKQESKIKVYGLNIIFKSKQNGCLISVNYTYDEINFDATIEMDYKDATKTIFKSNQFQKDLITIKIQALLKKCRKYMEILSLWKVNIDQKVQGIKECYICYLTVDSNDNTFPDFKCDQCLNKFHKRCFQRWAEQSKKYECPLCRHKFR